MSFGLKNPFVLKYWISETLNDQTSKTCPSAHNGLKDITKKNWQLPKIITTYYHINECKKQ